MTLALRSATEQAAALRAKEISSRELLDEHLNRVERLNPGLNAIVAMDVDRAQTTAKQLDDLAVRDQWAGPLHGLPCTIKDALDTARLVTTGGSAQLAGRVPDTDATAVARVRTAGAVIFGKTNLPAWSGDYQTAGGVYGTTNNPWDPSRVPGGSSGGAAAAVAACLTSFELGTDIGGSIRLPSSLCGTAGHKPTYGVVPQRGYVSHVGGGTTLSDINVVGPMARTVADLELLLGVLAGPEDPGSGWSLRLPDAAPGPWRVGVLVDDSEYPVAQEVRDAVLGAARSLQDGGCRLSDQRPPVSLGEASAVFLPLVSAAVALSAIDLAPPESRNGVDGTHADWLLHDITRTKFQRRWAAWFEDHDVLLMPAWPTPAPPHSPLPLAERALSVDGVEVPTMSASAWLGYAGVVGLPSTVVRVGTSSNGLPIGVQVVAASHRDRTALAVATQLESALDGYRIPPCADVAVNEEPTRGQ